MNLGRTQQRIRWLTVAVLVGSGLLLTILDSTGALVGVFGFLRDPLTGITEWTSARTDAVSDVVSGPRDLATAREEIDALKAQLAEQSRELEQLREIQSEAQHLRELVDHAAQTPEYNRVVADVIGQDTNPTMQSIIINKGVDDGVGPGMPVESARGLVGQVYDATNHAAQVVLLTETASAIPVRLGTTRATGILRGAGRGALPTIDWIDLQYEVEVGELVVTSGLDGKFPQNLVIGRVVDVTRNEAELFQQAVVQPAVDFRTLETLLVVTDFQAVDLQFFNQGQ